MGKGTLDSKCNRKIGKKWVDNLFKLGSGRGAEAPKAPPLLDPPLQSRVDGLYHSPLITFLNFQESSIS